MINKKNDTKYLLWLAIPIITFLCSYLIWGLYYERYEPFLTGLFSGNFTPGTHYNHFYLFGHILLLHLYSKLYLLFPAIPWLNIFLYLFLGLSLILIIKQFDVNKRYKKSTWFFMVLIAFFFIEQNVFFIYTRVSFLLSFAALLGLIISFKSNKLNFKTNFLFLLVIGLSILTRSEPVIIMIVLVSLFYFFVLSDENLNQRIMSSIKLFAIPSVLCLVIVAYYYVDISTSDMFFKQIEPELEYELMSRNNIKDISVMHTKVDSAKFKAIFNGMWGDATTNNAEFLRSLVKPNTNNNFNYLVKNAYSVLTTAILNSYGVFVLNTITFLILLLIYLYQKDKKYISLLLYHFIFWSIMFFKSYKIKMVETALSPILLSVAIMYLYLIKDKLNNFPKSLNSIIKFVLVLCVFFQITFITKHRLIFEEEHQLTHKERKYLEKTFKHKNIYLNQESSNIFAFSYKPFQKLDISSFNRVYYFDRQHLTTLEPYRTFLEKECNCDPNNYFEYFSFVKNGGEANIFIMTEDYKNFLTYYLQTVHQLELDFKKLEIDHSIGFSFNYQPLNIYEVSS